MYEQKSWKSTTKCQTRLDETGTSHSHEARHIECKAGKKLRRCEHPGIASKIPDKISKSAQNLNREVHMTLARNNKERRKA